MTTLRPGQNLLLNNRLWSLWQVSAGEGRQVALEAIGASEAARGMTRRLAGFQYGSELFIEQRRGGYWRANLEQDWQPTDNGPVLVCQPATVLDVLNAHTQSPALGPLANEFSWSYSRSARYRFCARAYYYHYYAAWEGWQPAAPPPVRTAYLLKNLTDLSRWVGTLVHDSLRFALARLKAGQPVSRNDLVGQMHRRAQADFENSQSGRYQQQPNALVGFQEHYYKIPLDKTTWQTSWQRAARLLDTFLQSELYTRLGQYSSDTFLEVETLHSFALAETKIWVQLDLARFDGQVIEIYAWKSGESDQASLRRQLGVYGLYLRQTYPEWHDKPLKGLIDYLTDNRQEEIALDPATLEAVEQEIKADIAHLRGLLVEPQINLAKIERFPMIDDRAICRSCQFRELCGR
ncbi:MAG: PD-(D/E)XK nuclease family protein [Anaerolineales bacterium]|nr:PD-(D/E)XK nuclease family protein [Anaerolineales bacterium]